MTTTSRIRIAGLAALPVSLLGASLAFAQTASTTVANTGGGASVALNLALLGASALVVAAAAVYLSRTAPLAERKK